MRHSLALVLGALALSACTDQIDRSPTSPFSPQFSFTTLDPTAKAAFEETIRGGIRCLIADNVKQEPRAINDFDEIVVEKADKGEVQAVTDWVNNFVKALDDYGSSKKTDPPVASECGGRTLSYAEAAQELYDLLYWYSGQYTKIVGGGYTDPDPDVDAGQVTCFPNLDCELDGQNAFIRAAAGTFNFPVVLGFHPLEGDLPADFNTVGTPVPPYYEFFTIPEGVIANGDGWGRFICIPHDAFLEGGGELYRGTNDGPVRIPGDGTQILCEPPPSTFSNSLLGRLQQFASRITAPVRPKVLYATGHRAIGGPSTAASPHAVVQTENVQGESCETFAGWSGDASGPTWDFKAADYPFTSLVSITIRLSTAEGVSVRARRFTSGGTGEKDLGFGTQGTPVAIAAEDGGGFEVSYTWPTQPVTPGGSVEFNVSSTSGPVTYGLAGAEAEGCALTTIDGGLGVTGSLSGHSGGGGEQEPTG